MQLKTEGTLSSKFWWEILEFLVNYFDLYFKGCIFRKKSHLEADWKNIPSSTVLDVNKKEYYNTFSPETIPTTSDPPSQSFQSLSWHFTIIFMFFFVLYPLLFPSVHVLAPVNSESNCPAFTHPSVISVSFLLFPYSVLCACIFSHTNVYSWNK